MIATNRWKLAVTLPQVESCQFGSSQRFGASVEKYLTKDSEKRREFLSPPMD
jgi:hypothetical protein